MLVGDWTRIILFWEQTLKKFETLIIGGDEGYSHQTYTCFNRCSDLQSCIYLWDQVCRNFDEASICHVESFNQRPRWLSNNFTAVGCPHNYTI